MTERQTAKFTGHPVAELGIDVADALWLAAQMLHRLNSIATPSDPITRPIPVPRDSATPKNSAPP